MVIRIFFAFFTLWANLSLAVAQAETKSSVASQSLHFNEATASAGIRFQQIDGRSGEKYFLETLGAGAAWFDYDNDLDLDIYFVNGADLPGMHSEIPPTNVLYRNNGDHTFTDVFLTSHPMRCEKKPMPKSVMMDTDSAVALATMITMDLRTSISRILAQMSCTVTTVTGRLPTEQRHQVSVTSDGAPVPLLLIMTETAIWIYLSPTTWHINWRTTPSVIGSVPDFLVLHAGSGEKATHFLRPCLLVTASTACR